MSRRAINYMNTVYPDATAEELRQGDNVCIICREEMVGGGAKKLPCNHIFHASCLRSWFQVSFYFILFLVKITILKFLEAANLSYVSFGYFANDSSSNRQYTTSTTATSCWTTATARGWLSASTEPNAARWRGWW